MSWRRLYAMWPDFTFEEAGYEDLHRLFGYGAVEGQEPIVVDAPQTSRRKQSTGIGKIAQEEVTLPGELEEVYARCRPYYEDL